MELGVEGIFRLVKVLPMSMKVLGFHHNSECAPVLLTLTNPSWHLRVIRAVSSAVAGDGLFRRDLAILDR